MGMRVAETDVPAGALRPELRIRVDLHGISASGPGITRELIRWEWIEQISEDGGVVVSGAGHRVGLPPGTFGLEPAAMAGLLQEARGIDRRPDVIERLAGLAR